MIKDKIIEYWSTIVSASAITILSLSVVYDIGYLFYSGLTLSEVPTTISEHIRSSLVWLPLFLFLVFLIYLLEFFFFVSERGMSEDDIIASSKHKRFTTFFRKGPYYLIIIGTPLVPILALLGVKIPAFTWQFFAVKFKESKSQTAQIKNI